jgi:hypothetical protein
MQLHLFPNALSNHTKPKMDLNSLPISLLFDAIEALSPNRSCKAYQPLYYHNRKKNTIFRRLEIL